MKTFSDRINESVQPEPVKFGDKTKENIYLIIKGESDPDKLTEKIHNFVLREKSKTKLELLESEKTILSIGTFDFSLLNEQIEKLKKELYEKV